MAALFAALLACCASYNPMPLTPEAIEKALEAPGEREVRVRASEINHPILKPIPFDGRDGLSPDEAAILAVIANPWLRAARDARGLAAAQTLQAGIIPNPEISYSFETPVGGDTSGKVNAFGLELDWDVASLISRGARKEAARSHADSLDLEVAWKEWQVAEAAKLGVYRVVIAEKGLALAEASTLTGERAFDAARRGADIGVVTAARLSLAKTNLDKAQLDLLQARAELNAASLELKRVLGMPGDWGLEVEKNVSLMEVQDIPAIRELTIDIEKRRLDLMALQYGYKSQDARLRGAIRARFPKIRLGLIGAQDTDGVQTVGAGISIGLPIFDRNQGRTAIERATRKQLFDEYAARLFEARTDIARIVEEMLSTDSQLDNTDRSIEDLKELAEGYRKAADRGTADIFDYYDILFQLNAKQAYELTLQRRLSSLEIGLEIASGRHIFTGDGDSGRGEPEAVGPPEYSE